MDSPVIVGGVRTPFVKAAGSFNYLPAQELGRLAVRELLERLNLEPDAIDEVITGNVAGTDAANVSRVISLRAGIPVDRVAHTVNRNCASGLEAVTQAYERIRTGQAQAVIARARALVRDGLFDRDVALATEAARALRALGGRDLDEEVQSRMDSLLRVPAN